MPSDTTNPIEPTELLRVCDVRDLLTSFAAAISSDKLSVVPIHYNAAMWSLWRNVNLKFVKKLLETTDDIPEVTLSRLSLLARNYHPSVVSKEILDLLALVAGGSVDEGDMLPAACFFELLVGDVSRRPTGSPQINGSSRNLMALWFPLQDPLRIALDPECRITTKSQIESEVCREAPVPEH
jgi:hypothetical protein